MIRIITNIIKWELSRRRIESYLVNYFIFKRCMDASVGAFRKFVTCLTVDIKEKNNEQNQLNVHPFSFFGTRLKPRILVHFRLFGPCLV